VGTQFREYLLCECENRSYMLGFVIPNPPFNDLISLPGCPERSFHTGSCFCSQGTGFSGIKIVGYTFPLLSMAVRGSLLEEQAQTVQTGPLR
jgi:hypothetical protein